MRHGDCDDLTRTSCKTFDICKAREQIAAGDSVPSRLVRVQWEGPLLGHGASVPVAPPDFGHRSVCESERQRRRDAGERRLGLLPKPERDEQRQRKNVKRKGARTQNGRSKL